MNPLRLTDGGNSDTQKEISTLQVIQHGRNFTPFPQKNISVCLDFVREMLSSPLVPDLYHTCMGIDERLLAMSPLKAKKYCVSIIQDYWHLIAESPEGSLIHQKIDERLTTMMLTLLKSIDVLKHHPASIVKIAPLSIEKKELLLREMLQNLKQELSEAKTKEEAVQLEYLILKGTLIGPSWSKWFTNQFCLVLKEQAEKKVQTYWMPLAQLNRDMDVDHLKQAVQQQKERLRTDENLNEPAFRGIEENYLERLQNRLQEAENRNIYQSACANGENPADLDQFIRPLSHYDQCILKLLFSDQSEQSIESRSIDTQPTINLDNLDSLWAQLGVGGDPRKTGLA